MVMTVVCLWGAWSEDGEFTNLVAGALPAPIPATGVVTNQANAKLLLHHVHTVVNEKTQLMGSNRGKPVSLLRSPGDHLRHPSGACASYSTVLARTLQSAGFQVRKVGLAGDGEKAQHHVVETQIEGHWVLMDALYDLTFKRPDGQLASAREVSQDWPAYKLQTPPNYTPSYDYKGYYYTNWDRIPGMAMVFKLWPSLPGWLDKSEVSLRFIFLDVWRWLAAFWATMAVSLVVVRRWSQRQLVRH
jgi:hypothetical protein